jgi:DNA (cytosine-5)-methyltransferase 1
MGNNCVKFIDLFAGMGGIRIGFEIAAKSIGINTECVLTSEIKPHAIKVLKQNFSNDSVSGDITKIANADIPDFDFLFGGFPCQSFSAAGKRMGFLDTRGTMFFEIERILKAKKPFGFILENVEGLINHDKANKNDKIGRTLETILKSLKKLDYQVEWKLLNSKNFGLAQDRKRVYIVGTKVEKPSLENFEEKTTSLESILEKGKPTVKSRFIDLLLSHYSIEELYGKSIKDKRGGKNNIHSWDIELKGKVTNEQKLLLNQLFKERRKKHWADEFGIDWMDGMPLTLKQISSFNRIKNLELRLDELVKLGYLKKEHPKKLIKETNLLGEVNLVRKQDFSLPIGYNIVAGKLSFEVNKILSPKEVAPTLVAMDMKKLFVADNDGLRTLTLNEGLKLFGYPKNYKFEIGTEDGYDLLGNTVCVPIITSISERILPIWLQTQKISNAKNQTNNKPSLQQINI